MFEPVKMYPISKEAKLIYGRYEELFFEYKKMDIGPRSQWSKDSKDKFDFIKKRKIIEDQSYAFWEIVHKEHPVLKSKGRIRYDKISGTVYEDKIYDEIIDNERMILNIKAQLKKSMLRNIGMQKEINGYKERSFGLSQETFEFLSEWVNSHEQDIANSINDFGELNKLFFELNERHAERIVKSSNKETV